MSKNVSLSVNGQYRVPPGFRFHPTEEELLHYYLRKKVAFEKIDLDVVRDVDLNKLEPWDIQEKCTIGSTPQNDWYFFSHKDKKYPTGTRTNRATAAGFWKATGRDKAIYSNGTRIGMRKTLVFYRGRAPHGRKSDWIMHEYRLDENNIHDPSTSQHVFDIDGGNPDQLGPEEGWVICRAFKKKNYRHKALSVSELVSSDENIYSNNIIDQILMCMGKSSPPSPSNPITSENRYSIDDNNRSIEFLGPAFAHLPGLEILALNTIPVPGSFNSPCNNRAEWNTAPPRPEAMDWATLDLLVTSHLNGHPNYSAQFCSFGSENFDCQDFPLFPFDDHDHEAQFLDMQNCDVSISSHRIVSSSSHEPDFWSFGVRSSSSSSTISSSSSYPLSHLSV